LQAHHHYSNERLHIVEVEALNTARTTPSNGGVGTIEVEIKRSQSGLFAGRKRVLGQIEIARADYKGGVAQPFPAVRRGVFFCKKGVAERSSGRAD
jgi:hypothetical protein